MSTTAAESGPLKADQDQIERFVSALFRYAVEGTFASLRAFHQFDAKQPPFLTKAVPINGSLSPLIAAATKAAQRCASNRQPIVFAPPIATFSNPDRARGVDLADGLALSVEIDDADPEAARARLEQMLGPVTVAVESGSFWTDPKTGECKPRAHLHWRLSEPTTTPEEHGRLRQARKLATMLVGADPTGGPIVHPLRWPGSWNRKATPRLTVMASLNDAAEIHLVDALERLTEAVEAAGWNEADIQQGSGQPEAPIELVRSAMSAIPNPGADVHYDDWIRFGYAAYRATGGSEHGFAAWDEWSRKSDKYNAAETKAAWLRIKAAIDGSNAPKTIGAGTIFYLAGKAGWQRPKNNGNAHEDVDEAARQRMLEQRKEEARANVGALLAEFNTLYMVVNENGKASVYAPTEDIILRRRFFDRHSFDDLRKLYLNRSVTAAFTKKGDPIRRNAADVWLRHPDRRQFLRGVTFDPSARNSADKLNLWQGFAPKPKPGNWTLMREHVRVIICRENQAHFDYLMGWMARLVQHPAEHGEVAVVMRGGEGTGKGTLARALKHILGQHALAISNAKHLTGNFNAHLRDCVLLFADEAFYAGDRAHVGVLKSIITEPYLTIEGKFQNAVQVPNFLHLMMASNEEWVVPASFDARRFFVLEVGDEARNNHNYFAEIWQQMEGGGYEAMLYDLLHRDISHFNVRNVPVTEALQHQKKLSLPTTGGWWEDVLLRGYVFKSKLGLEDYFGAWHEEVSTELLHASYLEFAERQRERHFLSRENLGRFLLKMGCRQKRLKDAIVGEHIVDVRSSFGTTRKADLIRQPRPHGYSLGSLPAARGAFEEQTGITTTWDAPEEPS